MAAEDLLVDDGSDRQTVEAVGERLPELDVVATLACDATNVRFTKNVRFTMNVRFTKKLRRHSSIIN